MLLLQNSLIICLALFAISLVALTLLPDHISYYQVPASILAKLYSNSMFALLNSRITFSPTAGTEGKSTAPTSQQITVLRFVETFKDPETAAVKVKPIFDVLAQILMD